MYQLGIKGEAYGKCVFIEYEWLCEFMYDVDYLAQEITRLYEMRKNRDTTRLGELNHMEFIVTRFSGLYYGIHNYFDENIESMENAVDYLIKRYEELKVLNVFQKRGICKCIGCGRFWYVTTALSGNDESNKQMIFAALKDVNRNA